MIIFLILLMTVNVYSMLTWSCFSYYIIIVIDDYYIFTFQTSPNLMILPCFHMQHIQKLCNSYHLYTYAFIGLLTSSAHFSISQRKSARPVRLHRFHHQELGGSLLRRREFGYPPENKHAQLPRSILDG